MLKSRLNDSDWDRGHVLLRYNERVTEIAVKPIEIFTKNDSDLRRTRGQIVVDHSRDHLTSTRWSCLVFCNPFNYVHALSMTQHASIAPVVVVKRFTAPWKLIRGISKGIVVNCAKCVIL